MTPVVLAAGRGRRLAPITDAVPKPLVVVGDQPLVSHCIDRLRRWGFDEMVIVVGYEANAVRRHVDRNHPDVSVRYVRQSDRAGTADAVLAVADAVSGEVLVTNADCLVEADFEQFVSRHRGGEHDATLLVEQASLDVARRSGVCSLASDGSLDGVVEKPDDPPSRLVLVGTYIFDKKIFDACRSIETSERGEYELPDAISRLLDRGCDVRPVEAAQWHHNVNSLSDVRAAERTVGE